MAHATFVTPANFDHQTIETIAKSHSKTTKIHTAKFRNYQKESASPMKRLALKVFKLCNMTVDGLWSYN